MTTLEIPKGIHFSDAESEKNFSRIASDEVSSGLLLIEGPKASGKSRLGLHLCAALGSEARTLTRIDEKFLEHILAEKKLRLVHIDAPQNLKPSGKEMRGKKLIPIPLESKAMIQGIEDGALIILTGENLLLSPDMERRAIRVRLKG